MRQGYYEEPAEPAAGGSNFSHGKTILVIAIVVGCFAVLWPKIFYPMLFGSQMDRQEETVAGTPRHFPGGGPGPGPGPGPGGVPGSEFLHPAMRERGRMAGMPEVGARPPIRTVDKEWGGRGGPMPGMRPTMGGPGIQPQQPRGSGTMGVLMPIYTVGIIIFFVYTTMKILFKNKDTEEEEDEYTQKRKRELKYRQEEEAEYARYTQNFNKLQKRPQELIEKDRKQYISDKEVPSPHTRIEEINQIVNDLKQETVKQISSQEVIPMDCTKTFLDPDTIKHTLPDPGTKRNESSNLETIKSTRIDPDALKDIPTDPDILKEIPASQEKEEAIAQRDDGKEQSETKFSKQEDPNKSGIINLQKTSEKMEKEASIDPRDLEINLLKKRLEETEKAMERIMAQMGTVTQQLLPQTLEATLLSHPALQTNCARPHDINYLEEKKELHSANQQNVENYTTDSDDDDDSMDENDVKDTSLEQDSE